MRHFSGLACTFLAFLAVTTTAAPIRLRRSDSEPTGRSHDTATVSPSLGARNEAFVPISPLPKVISARADDVEPGAKVLDEKSFNSITPPPKPLPPRSNEGIKERDTGFDPTSPPPKAIPPHLARDEHLMPGLFQRAYEPVPPPPKVVGPDGQGASLLKAREDGSVKIVPPPKVAQDHASIQSRGTGFDPVSPPPKTVPQA